MNKRIGFACKYMHPDQTQKKKLLEEIQRPLNTKSTTVRWLNSQPKEVAEQRLWDIMVHNIQSYENLIRYVGGLPMNYEWLDWAVMFFLYTLSLLGAITGNYLMWSSIVKLILGQSVNLQDNLMLGSVCILVSLLCWLLITLT